MNSIKVLIYNDPSHQDITPCVTAVDAANNNKHEALFSHQDMFNKILVTHTQRCL